MMKEKIKKFTAVLLALMLIPAACVRADVKMIGISLTGTYKQSEARKMLAMINEFRTGGDAWYWNETNTQKVYSRDLKPLVYDAALEKAAMTRAMELSLYYDHYRPGTGDGCMMVKKATAMGENISAGCTTAEEAFEEFREEYVNYEGQGHRRNMLYECYTRVGIGCVYADGCFFWVQLFGNGTANTKLGPACDTEETRRISVDPAKITTLKVGPVRTAVGQTADVTKIPIQIGTAYTWPFKTASASLKVTPRAGKDKGSVYRLNTDGSVTKLRKGTGRIRIRINGKVTPVRIVVY